MHTLHVVRRACLHPQGIIADLCDALDSLDEPDAKAALIWIVGEYSDRRVSITEVLTPMPPAPLGFQRITPHAARIASNVQNVRNTRGGLAF